MEHTGKEDNHQRSVRQSGFNTDGVTELGGRAARRKPLLRAAGKHLAPSGLKAKLFLHPVMKHGGGSIRL